MATPMASPRPASAPAPRAPSLAGRAILAVLLMIGFYLLALTISTALVFAVYAEARYAHRIHLKLALFCLGGAALIIWSIIPRPDKFVAPGPRLCQRASISFGP